MTLIYRFHKEKLDDGTITYRPKVLVDLSSGSQYLPFNIAALLDSGCDVTVIPEDFAKMLNLKTYGSTTLMSYREKTDVKLTKVDLTFLGQDETENVKLTDVPAFIAPKDDNDTFPEFVIGIRGIFDKFEINFDLGADKIELKKTDTIRRKIYY